MAVPLSGPKNYAKLGEAAYKDVEKINSELFTLTYGAIVTQLMKDYEDVEAVNGQLEKMGHNIGVRIIEEFLARSGLGRCTDFRETAEVLTKVGFKMFLGITAQVQNFDAAKNEFSLILDENPLAEFVELPDNCGNLWYSNVLCGVIKGALEMVQMKVEAKFVKDSLRGDDSTEIKVTFISIIEEEVPVGDD